MGLFTDILVLLITLAAVPVVLALLLHPFNSLLYLALPKLRAPFNINREAGYFGIVVTAWKSGVMVPPLVRSLAMQDFKNFHIWVVADQCEMSPEVENHPLVTVIYPEKPLNSKSKAIELALDSMDATKEQHPVTAAIIFDPDNLAAPTFLTKMNELWQAGYDLIQGRRTAKNVENAIAKLDGMGEAYYNFVNRTVPFELGGSSAVSGSGMLVSLPAYRSILGHPYFHTEEVIPAEDKFLQIQALRLGYKIGFAKDALVFDEKVSEGSQLERQRVRWLGSYFFYFGLGTQLLGTGLRRFSWHWIGFALLFLFPPVVLLAAATVMLLLAAAIIGGLTWMVTLVLAGSLCVFAWHYRWAVKQTLPHIQTRYLLLKLPAFAIRMLKAVFRIKESKKDFMATTNKHAVDLDQLPPTT